MQENPQFKVQALTRFLYAPTGRIYDANDIFEVKTESDFKYLTEEHKLCKVAPKDAEVTETEQDKQDKAHEIEQQRVEAEKAEALKVIEEKPNEPELNKLKQKIKAKKATS